MSIWHVGYLFFYEAMEAEKVSSKRQSYETIQLSQLNNWTPIKEFIVAGLVRDIVLSLQLLMLYLK